MEQDISDIKKVLALILKIQSGHESGHEFTENEKAWSNGVVYEYHNKKEDIYHQEVCCSHIY